MPGAVLRPLTFEPTVRKHAGRVCGGVQVHVQDRRGFRSYAAYLQIIAAMLAQIDEFPWRTEEYEYEKSRPAIDLLTGGPEYRQLVNQRVSHPQRDGVGEYLARDAEGASAFAEARRPHLIY